MAHTRADSNERQSALDALYHAVNELERLVTEEEARQERFSKTEGEKAQQARERFSAFRSAR
ncbi:hypothetical protein LWC35_18210 [Pseudonocardia kujensis]|uniref:hypothetical protein n=1 Tax=Pseudonocardia kujensis TaxID=1128675 RepID=UPI001E420F2F|nr:hypothetical protein [Pseudonocardia kujensis]MCE0764825.1 hypothetical protein [Pseudonocardia kujensis]